MDEQDAVRALKRDPRIAAKLSEYRRTNNWTNWLYIGRAWLIILLTIGSAVWFVVEGRVWMELSWFWNLPVTLLAVLVVGASQHQLAGAGHEATHGILFRNRMLNELASDWLCMFPLFSSTHSFRMYHMAHHHFVNDPDRDPDFAMLAASGHWMDFPVAKQRFLGKIARQLLLVDLFRYTMTRFLFNSMGGGKKGLYTIEPGTAWPKVIGAAYFFSTWGATRQLRDGPSLIMLFGVTLGILALSSGLMLGLPERHFEKSKIQPVYPLRWIAVSRMGFFTTLFLALGLVHRYTHIAAGPLFALFWALPLVTSFALCMMLRQLVQHGNADRGWMTNTRVFKMNPILRYAVFPFGMDYHTPHHMYASVPHYRLPRLHEFLLQFEPYRAACVEVHNYVLPRRRFPAPTVLDVLSRDDPKSGEIFIDESVALEDTERKAQENPRDAEITPRQAGDPPILPHGQEG